MARTLKHYPSVSLKLEDSDGKIDFVRIFGRAGPVHIEIGTGKAAFLLNQAKAQPEVNFLGVERANKYYRFGVDRIGRWGLTNVRIIRADAAAFLADFAPAGCVDCCHIYFPDPWPKRRHHKRRFFTAARLEQVIRMLKTGGIIKVATDDAEYFDLIKQLFEGEKARLQPTEFLPAAGADVGEWVGTNFERKYLKQNRPIYTIAVRKTR